MKTRTLLLGAALALFTLAAAVAVASPAGAQERVAICHRVGSATGGNQHNGYSLISIDENAVSAHIGDDAHPAKGGREDFAAYDGSETPCDETQNEEEHRYRVVAGMPRYRGVPFFDEDGLTCRVHTWITPQFTNQWIASCGDHTDRGELRGRTYVRLRDLTDGSVTVLIDRR